MFDYSPGAEIWGFAPMAGLPAAVRTTQGWVGDRVTFTWITFRDRNLMMKKAKSGRKKRSVTCKKVQAPPPTTLPHECN